MKVAFDARAAKDERGIGRYARSLLQALRESDRGEVVETHAPRRCDLFHSPWIEGAMLRCQVPQIVTLHDLVALKRRGEYARNGIRFRLRYLAVQNAARVIVPTHAVAEDAERMLGIAPQRIAVIPKAPASVFWPRPADEVSAVRARFGLPDEYLLRVGALRQPDRRKRVAALARCKRSLPLVLVGPAGRWAHDLPGVVRTGAVDDEQLAAIYTGAHALVLASDDEGVGLPPLEALACGTPVAACDIPAVREVLAGRAALSAADDLDALIANAESLARPAPAPPTWSWDEAARLTWDAYGQALRKAAVRRAAPTRPRVRAHYGAGGARRHEPQA
jgi:glycosyltransferase involved in cell wall biosynthesis